MELAIKSYQTRTVVHENESVQNAWSRITKFVPIVKSLICNKPVEEIKGGGYFTVA